jgi:threonine aldolase
MPRSPWQAAEAESDCRCPRRADALSVEFRIKREPGYGGWLELDNIVSVPDQNTIDLRSDTVTKPSPAMRRAMADAEVGDDVYMEDPTVERLQQRAAEIFGKEAALFVSSGSLGNLVCLKALTNPGEEVICESRGHIYNYEMGAMCSVAGTIPRTIFAEHGILRWAQIREQIRPRIYYRPQTTLVALESSHNIAGGTVYPREVIDDICDNAHAAGIRVHMDGARIFNAATYLGASVRHLTAKCDSVQFCLSKGLGAPVGSMVAGSRELVERARALRKVYGGGMRQVGVLAAAGLIALEQGPKRLHEDHRNARCLAEGLAHIPGISVDLAAVQTNIVIFDVKGTGLAAPEFQAKLKERGVLASGVDGKALRMVTHLDVDSAMIGRAVEAVAEVASYTAAGSK